MKGILFAGCCFGISAVALGTIFMFGGSHGSQRLGDQAKAQAELAKALAEKAGLEIEKAEIEAKLRDATTRFHAAESDIAKLQAELSRSRASLKTMSLLQSASGLAQIDLPEADWAPERVVVAYFRAPSLAHRLAVVNDPERVKPLMDIYYRNHIFAPIENALMDVPKTPISIGDTLSVPIKLPGQSEFNLVLMRTDVGFRVDWIASKDNWEAAGASDHPLAGPREVFIAEAVRQEWMQPWHTELAMGKTIRSGELDIHLDKIVRTGDRLQMFLTVTNIGTMHVFSPEKEPYNDAMRRTGHFADSFSNWSLITIERGTDDLKPGQSATIVYAADIKIEAPLYLWSISLETSNALLNLSSFYVICSSNDFSER